MKSRIIFILLMLFFVSCKKKETKDVKEVKIAKQENDYSDIDQDEVVTMNAIRTNYDTLVNRVKKMGDEDAYLELFYDFKESAIEVRTDSVMVYAKIMALQHNYERGYYDYLQALYEKYNVDYSDSSKIDISKLDKVSKKSIEDWLKLMLDKKIMTKKDFDAIKR
ncbi:ABC transporter permease [Flavobacterium bizetiae]|uniref:ABC transporter permease n=1 Tax=Flavobacterium bizetiae TaxID=2704140 RepID=UPI0021E955B4|nr:ABC transporter permease [Flavobacterium bizetiae]UTN04819.1 ABC transporter permease [Flavobacterium bizetiae]